MSAGAAPIHTPDQRVRVFVSSTLGELAEERRAVRDAIEALHLVPVMFELGARPHPPRELYRAYLAQSHVFVGIYGQRYGWVAPGETVSGLEDEYRLAGDRPRLIYLCEPAPDRDPRLEALLADIRDDDLASYAHVRSPEELGELVGRDLAVLLSERFEAALTDGASTVPPAPPVPAPLTPTIGRAADVTSLTDLLDTDVRLVTLTGVGGIGKTRVAQEVARAVQAREDGRQVHLVPLAPVRDARGVVPAIVDHVGARMVGRQSPLEALADRLRQEPTLLVLDNLEQVVAAGPDLVELLRACPRLQVLATSRQALGVEGEHVVPLSPLANDDPAAAAVSAELAPAVELFVARARAVHPGFTLTADNVGAVAEVCRLVDALPLGIELAAARSRLLPPSALADRLRGRLDLLVGGADRPGRQRTLAATIAWSHELLPPEEQALFARLAVFAGGCTVSAAEQVCDVEGEGRVLDGLAALIDKSLLVVDEQDDPRVRMLETVRTYAIERLDERGETGLLRDRHLAYVRELTDRAQPFLCGPHQLDWSARMDVERPNLRAAVAHALDRGRITDVVDMAWDVYVYYVLRGSPGEPGAWIHAADAHRDQLAVPTRAVLDAALAIEDVAGGMVERAHERLVPALAVFDAHAMELERAVAHMYLGLVALGRGDLSDGVAEEVTASALFQAIAHDWGAASSEANLGLLHWLADRPTAAANHYERSLAFAERIHNEHLAGQALVGLASIALDDGDLPGALARLEQAVPLLQRCRDAMSASTCLDVLAAAALSRGRSDVALRALAAADGTRTRVGTPHHGALQARVERVLRATRRELGEEAAEPLWDAAHDLDPLMTMPEVLASVT